MSDSYEKVAADAIQILMLLGLENQPFDPANVKGYADTLATRFEAIEVRA